MPLFYVAITEKVPGEYEELVAYTEKPILADTAEDAKNKVVLDLGKDEAEHLGRLNVQVRPF